METESFFCFVHHCIPTAWISAWHRVGAQQTLVHCLFEGDVSKAGLALPDVSLVITGSGQGSVALCLFADCPLSPPSPSRHGFYGDEGSLAVLLPEHQDLSLPS